MNAAVELAGLAAGLPGLYEVRVVVPDGVAGGDAVEVEVVMRAAGQESNRVTMAVR